MATNIISFDKSTQGKGVCVSPKYSTSKPSEIELNLELTSFFGQWVLGGIIYQPKPGTHTQSTLIFYFLKPAKCKMAFHLPLWQEKARIVQLITYGLFPTLSVIKAAE